MGAAVGGAQAAQQLPGRPGARLLGHHQEGGGALPHRSQGLLAVPHRQHLVAGLGQRLRHRLPLPIVRVGNHHCRHGPDFRPIYPAPR
jgi:hypothetical protein